MQPRVEIEQRPDRHHYDLNVGHDFPTKAIAQAPYDGLRDARNDSISRIEAGARYQGV